MDDSASVASSTTYSEARPPASSSYDDPRVSEILQSDIGVDILLKRLKLSIASGKELTTFIKKREALERSNANALIHLVKTTHENIVKQDSRDSSFLRNFDATTKMHEQLANHSVMYASELAKLVDDLTELCKRTDKNRKALKEKAVKDEKAVAEAEQAAEKQKAKYYALCDDLLAVRNNDPSKRVGLKLKASKNTQQQIDELTKKVAVADLDYRDKVVTAKDMYSSLIKTHRPDNIQNLQNELRVFDSGLTLHFMRYANVTERLALSHGLTVSPMKRDGFNSMSITDLANDIDVDGDFVSNVIRARAGASLVHRQVEYVKHDSIENVYKPETTRQGVTSRPAQSPAAVAGAAAALKPQPSSPAIAARQPKQQSSQSNSPVSVRQPTQATTPASLRQPTAPQPVSALRQQQPPPQINSRTTPQSPSLSTPYPVSSYPTAPYPQKAAGLGLSAAGVPPAAPANGYGANGGSNGFPAYFGTDLDVLMQHEREALQVESVVAPMFVIRAIEAIDTFGLEKEGIYSVPGVTSNAEHIYNLVQRDGLNLSFEDPSVFNDDILALASTLKLYFRQLPEPLLTNRLRSAFIAAAQNVEEDGRRDLTHGAVNELPDSNYTTLKYLIFHLYRVQEKYRLNNMTINKLGAAWGASLATNDADAAWCSTIPNLTLSASPQPTATLATLHYTCADYLCGFVSIVALPYDAMRNRFRPKHQRLILQCYPPGRSQEKHPNSSELSYLLYYVSTRRTKLQKVGRYLERKARSDVWRARSGNVQVTLDITKALIDKCPNDLNVFADYVISILTTVLNSADLALCQYSLAAFKSFCEHHDGGLLVDDKDFVHLFIGLLELYMSVGSKATNASDSGWKLIRLHAANCIAASEAISSLNGQLRQQIQIIAPVILDELYSDSMDLSALDSEVNAMESAVDSSRTPRTSTGTLRPQLTVSNADDSENPGKEASILALQALRRLFDTINDTNVSQIRYASFAVVNFIIAHPNNESWSMTMIDLMARWTPVQLRFVILRSLLEVLASLSIRDTAKNLVVTKLVASLLSSRVNLAGLSVTDVLHLLFSQILRLLQLDEAREADPAGLRGELVSQLVRAIGGLATHIYYSDQISDMVTEILLRIRPVLGDSDYNATGTSSRDNTTDRISEPPSTVNSFVNLDKYMRRNERKSLTHKSAILVALKVVKEILEVANMMESGVKRSNVPLQTWAKTEWALMDDPDVRQAYADALLAYFNNELEPDSVSFKHTRPQTGFLAHLHLAMYDFCLQPSNTVSDYKIINSLLITASDRLGLFAILRGLPMVLRLQETIHSGLPLSDRPKLPASSLVTLDTMVLKYYALVAAKLQIPALASDVNAVISKRKTSMQWDDNLSLDEVKKPNGLKFSFEDDSYHHIDRAAMKEYIQSSALKLPDSVRAELTSDWNREAILRDEAEQSSIADSDAPLILHVVSHRKSKPNRPIRSAW